MSTDIEPTSTIVEIAPEITAVFGDIPEGLEPIDFGLLPEFDRAQLTAALSAIGNTAAITGGTAQAMTAAQGLYRVTAETQKLLSAGATMALKDGAQLGAVMRNGKIIAQARFVPIGAGAAAGALATIGPALAMVALQIALSDVTTAVKTNTALLNQTLTTIRNEQWAELTGHVETMERATTHAKEIGSVPETLWQRIAPYEATLRKHMELYRKNVQDHIKQLDTLDGKEERQYLITNAEAILFDTQALLFSLRAHTQFQVLHAYRARVNETNDPNEAKLFDIIINDTRAEVKVCRNTATTLVAALTRQLRLIAELPGRRTLPLLPQRRSKQSQLTSAQLLEAIEPLADALNPIRNKLDSASTITTIAPEGYDTDVYVRILRWLLNDNEHLLAIAFPHQMDSNNPLTMVSTAFDLKMDASWNLLRLEKKIGTVSKAVSASFIAVTDARIITANPHDFRNHGTIKGEVPRSEIRHIRFTSADNDNSRTKIDVTTEKIDFHWIFPVAANNDDINTLAQILEATPEVDAHQHPEMEK